VGDMMLGIKLNLSKEDKTFVVEALNELIPTLKAGEKPIFHLAKSKVLKEDSLFDGMFMRCLEQALEKRETNSRNQAISKKCQSLTQFITKERLNFQYGAMSRLSLAGA
jgi:hypothetical protein